MQFTIIFDKEKKQIIYFEKMETENMRHLFALYDVMYFVYLLLLW